MHCYLAKLVADINFHYAKTPLAFTWLLGISLNHQEPQNMTELSIAVVIEGGYCLFYCNIFILI
jgi:hypothetical protein